MTMERQEAFIRPWGSLRRPDSVVPVISNFYVFSLGFHNRVIIVVFIQLLHELLSISLVGPKGRGSSRTTLKRGERIPTKKPSVHLADGI